MDRTQAVVGVEDLKKHHLPSDVRSERAKTDPESEFSGLGRVRRLRQVSEHPQAAENGF
jgi:hypothetical protein